MTFSRVLLPLLFFGLQVQASGGPGDSLLLKPFQYHAPESSMVFLVWNSESHPADFLLEINSGSSLNKNMLYTPMVSKDGIFTAEIQLPANSAIFYTFWITKNRRGQYQDYWDRKSSGRLQVSDTLPVIKTAHYAIEQKPAVSRAAILGFIAFLCLLGIYLILKLVNRRRYGMAPLPTIEYRIVYTGLSILIFYGLARAMIIGLPLAAPYKDFQAIPKIIRAGFEDILVVSLFTVLFIVMVGFIRNPKVKRAVFGLFLLLSALLTLVAFANISVVTYLGRPLNYQWLYYSDFLGSEDAKSAFSAQFSLLTCLWLCAIIVSMFLLSGIISRAHFLSLKYKATKIAVPAVVGIFVLTAVVFAIQLKHDWPAGKKENALLSLTTSWFTANKNPSFFSLQLSDTLDIQLKTDRQQPIQIKDNSALRNVLFIVLESAGAQYFDGYGGNYHLSPNLNFHKAHALQFTNVYAHAPGTNRSMVSLLGSIFPKISYRSITQDHPNISHPTISSVLHEKGYRTALFSSADLSFQNSSGFLARRGFDRVDGFEDIPCQDQFELNSNNYREGNGIDDLCLANHLATWLDNIDGQNFFSVLWTVQGHYPYYFEGEETDFGVSDISFNRYLNILNHYDKLVGRVMELLTERSLDKSTLVVVTGDHGEAFGQHQQYGHGSNIYEENLKVPLYFINAESFDGMEVEGMASLKDIPSTTLALLGIDQPSSWQGINLLKKQPEEQFFFAPWSDYLFGYRKDGFKYIFNETSNSIQLFDLHGDPEETRNLAGPETEKMVEQARQRVASWVQQHETFINTTLSETTQHLP